MSRKADRENGIDGMAMVYFDRFPLRRVASHLALNEISKDVRLAGIAWREFHGGRTLFNGDHFEIGRRRWHLRRIARLDRR